MTVKSDIERYRTNYLAERDGSELYKSLAETERDPHLAELYRRMAETEQRHANIWADYLRKAGETVPTYTADWRIRMIIWLAKRFGVNSVLPMVTSMERGASHRSEEHTSELQSRRDLVCRLLLEKKKKKKNKNKSLTNTIASHRTPKDNTI